MWASMKKALSKHFPFSFLIFCRHYERIPLQYEWPVETRIFARSTGGLKLISQHLLIPFEPFTNSRYGRIQSDNHYRFIVQRDECLYSLQ